MSKVMNIAKCKCPKCKKGDIFNSKGNIFLFQIPKMNSHCKVCGYKFEKETGFFFGAMYVSYALAVVQMLASFIILWHFIGLSLFNAFLTLVLIVILASTFNFRVSRAIWIYIFHKK
ncbi:DUF983 domain-containing protein [Mangrovimonas aestuarii]|uniref:DUF983 domain-containing protein n=1 Tax=Mangrovimonas aestuarii TaxID=3018443 RepID=UPI0029E81B85|nr:DUF983 domain-containing protein [Mangrovimonas aestuarii]